MPLLISYPGKFKPGVSQRAVDSTDFMPTLLELAGHPVGEQVQGASLAQHLRGEKERGAVREYAFCERVRPNPKGRRKVLPDTRGDFMIRGRGWKYIRYGNRLEYLYDLREDPGETVNLIDDPKCGSVRDQLTAEMDKWLDRTGWTGHRTPKRVFQELIVGPSPSEKPRGTKAEAGDIGYIVDAGRQSHGALQPGKARATFETPSYIRGDGHGRF